MVYKKAASRFRKKEKYLKQKYPERFITANSNNLSSRTIIRKKTNSFIKIFQEIINTLKNPYAHLMIFRFLVFVWADLYFSLPSLLPLLILFHSFVFDERKFYISCLKFMYLPLLWLIFLYHYIVNIEGFVKEVFGMDIFTVKNRRYGMYNYDSPFLHLLFQFITLFYGCFT